MSHCDEETLSVHSTPFRNIFWPRCMSLPLFCSLLFYTLQHPESELYNLSGWHRVWATITMEIIQLLMSDVHLPVDLSLYSDWRRSDNVCCFGTRITHTLVQLCHDHSTGYYSTITQASKPALCVRAFKRDMPRSMYIYSSVIVTQF